MPTKKRYKVNSSNSLVLKDKEQSCILNGNFSTNKNNKLIYLLNEPVAWRRKYSLPGRLKFEGHWRLNRNYDLVLDITETKKAGIRDELVLRGNIIAVEAKGLVFEIKSKDVNGNTRFGILKLNGFWQADEYNRLCFLATKKNGSPDEIAFTASWQLNKNQQITYSYEKTDLSTKERRIHNLTFEGFWQINEANRLKYILSGSSKSAFDFRAQIESPNLYPQEGKIKYRLGIGYGRHNTKDGNIITLYGDWKFSRKGTLGFEMDYGRLGLHSIEFNLEHRLSDRDAITLGLSNSRDDPLGIAITFTRRLFQSLNQEVYLKLKGKAKEASAEVGFRTPF